MELRHLRYFVAVAESENVTRAAAQLHISQPPLTRQIQELEQELGVALFTRKGRSLRLTDTGRLFLAEARACLGRVDQALEKVRTAPGSISLNLGYAPSPTVEILPRLLKALKKSAPSLHVVLHDHSSPEMLAGIRDGRLDAALMMEPSPRVATGLTFTKIQAYPFGIAMPRGHRLSRRRTVQLTDIRSEPVVAYSKKDFPDYHAFLRKRLGRLVNTLKVEHECDSGGSLVAAVESGRGVALTGAFLTAGIGHRLKFIPFDPPLNPAIVGLACPAKEPSLAAKRLLEAAQAIWKPNL